MSSISEFFGKGKEGTMLMAMVGSFVLGNLVMLAAQPWTDLLGISYSVERIALLYAVTALCWLIPGILSMYLFSMKKEWLAPPGRYTPDIEYNIFSPYTLTAAAIVGAVFAVGGLATGINIDLPDLVTSFTAVYFGPVVCFLAFFFGFLIRYLIGALAWLPTPLILLPVAWLDGGTWALNSFIYWNIMRRLGKNAKGALKMIYFSISVAIMIVIYLFLGVLLTWAFVMNPWAAFVGYTTFALSTWMSTAIVFIILGALIGESVYQSRIAEATKEIIE